MLAYAWCLDFTGSRAKIREDNATPAQHVTLTTCKSHLENRMTYDPNTLGKQNTLPVAHSSHHMSAPILIQEKNVLHFLVFPASCNVNTGTELLFG